MGGVCRGVPMTTSSGQKERKTKLDDFAKKLWFERLALFSCINKTLAISHRHAVQKFVQIETGFLDVFGAKFQK